MLDADRNHLLAAVADADWGLAEDLCRNLLCLPEDDRWRAVFELCGEAAESRHLAATLTFLGSAFARRNIKTEAGKCFLRAIELEPRAISPRFQLAGILANRDIPIANRHWDRVLTLFREVLTLQPDNKEALMGVGHCWLESMLSPADWDEEALGSFQKVTVLEPRHHRAFFRLGLVHNAQGRTSQAVEAFERALRLKPDYADAHLRLSLPELQSQVSSEVRTLVRRPQSVDTAPMVFEGAEDPLAIIGTLKASGGALVRGLCRQEDSDLLASILDAELSLLETGDRSLEDYDAFDAGSIYQATGAYLAKTGILSLFTGYFEGQAPGSIPRPRRPWHAQTHVPKHRRPAELHQDNPFLVDRSAYLTGWLTFVPCGRGKAPGLEIFPVDFDCPVHFTGTSDGFHNLIDMDFVSDFLSDCSWVPDIDPGDFLVFRPTIFHRTHYDDTMAGLRKSIDIRFDCGPTAAYAQQPAWGAHDVQATGV